MQDHFTQANKLACHKLNELIVIPMFHAPFLNMHSIFLVGFRASGKSTIGKILANALTDFFSCSSKKQIDRSELIDNLKISEDKKSNLNYSNDLIYNEYNNFLCKKWAWIDTDESIVEYLGQDIDNIVAAKGWDYFRQQESAILQKCKEPYTVYSTGGGAILLPENSAFISNQGYVIYLKATSNTILERLRNNPQKNQRPALTGESLETEIESTLQYRVPLYEKTADIIVDAESEVHIIIKNILKQYVGNYLYCHSK